MLNIRVFFEKIKTFVLFSCLSLMFFFAIIAIRYTLLNSSITEIKINSKINRVTKDEIISNLQITPTSTIFGYDIHSANERLSQIPFIRTASLKRRFPNTIVATVNEKTVIAIFQENDTFYPLDGDGKIILEKILTLNEDDYIIISGYGAPVKFLPVFKKIRQSLILNNYVAQIEHIENRRFNIVLKDGKTIMLPAANPQTALDNLITLHTKRDLLNKNFRRLDLRDAKRILIEL